MFRVAAVALTLTAGGATEGGMARAEPPAALCERLGTDDTTRPIPDSLVAAANAALGTSLPADAAIASTVFRCAEGHLLVCTVGANLACGKADTSRQSTAGMTAWCRAHPDADFVPAFASGHDTIFAWHCIGAIPRVIRQTSYVDGRGFIADNWKTVP
jgi:hypothetical protein